jgi:hypothetical protein
LTSNISSWIRTNLGYDRQRPISIMDSSQPLGTMPMLEFYFEQVPVRSIYNTTPASRLIRNPPLVRPHRH